MHVYHAMSPYVDHRGWGGECGGWLPPLKGIDARVGKYQETIREICSIVTITHCSLRNLNVELMEQSRLHMGGGSGRIRLFVGNRGSGLDSTDSPDPTRPAIYHLANSATAPFGQNFVGHSKVRGLRKVTRGISKVVHLKEPALYNMYNLLLEFIITLYHPVQPPTHRALYS